MSSQLGSDEEDRFLADAREDLDCILQRVSEDVANAINTAIESDIQRIGPDAYFVNKWRTLRPLYKQLASSVADYCRMLLRLKNIECLVYARAKEVDSARRTVQRRIEWGNMHQQPIRTLKDMFSEMHDLSGTMIVVNQPKMDAVNKIIKEFFEEVGNQTDWEAPAQHISTLGNHKSYNHHVTLSKKKYHEAAKFEIQVVSYQTHTYSMVSHDWEYKGMHGPLEKKDKFVLEILKSTGCTYDLVSQYFEQRKAEISTSIGQHHLYFASQGLNGPLPIDLTIEQASDSTAINKSEISLQQVRDDIATLSSALHHNTSLLRQFDSNARVGGTAIAGNSYITSETNTSARSRLSKPTTSRKAIRDIRLLEQHHTGGKSIIDSHLSSQANKGKIHNHFNDTLRASDRGDKLDKYDILATQPTTSQAHDNTWTAVPERLRAKSTMTYPDLPTDTWVRSVASFKSLQYGRNRIFGTVMISTTVVSYKRDSRDNPDNEEKQEKQRSIKYIPPRWISSWGVVYSKTTMKWLNLHTQSDPTFRPRTVNIVPYESEIIQACENWEFAKIYDLFETGKASPYDMDKEGGNVLGWLGVGPLRGSSCLRKIADENLPTSDVNVIAKLTTVMEEFVKFIKRLTEWGVDASELEEDEQSPFMMLLSAWCHLDSDLAIHFEDMMKYILGFLLVKARSTPFGGGGAFVTIGPGGQYFIYHSLSLLRGTFNYPLTSEYLELLLQQDQWPITWNAAQLSIVCSLYGGPDPASLIVQHWVLSTAHDIETDLGARLRLLQTLLQAGAFNTSVTIEGSDWSDAFHNLIHRGGNILDLLTEHTYGSSGTLPWIRHRFRKTILVREWMLNTFSLLLRLCPACLIEEWFLEHISNHARQHNARVKDAWEIAKRHCSRVSAIIPPDSQFMSGANTDDNSVETEWETDYSNSPGSAWETEEEWEEGPLLGKARDVDPQDDKNRQKRRPHGYTCEPNMEDFDEEYWSHVYHIFEEDTESSPEKAGNDQRFLGEMVRTASTLLSYVV